MLNVLHAVRWRDLVDILLVSIIIYRLILLIRGTRAVQMLVGIVIITIFYFISKQFDLLTLHWLLRTFLNSIFLIVIIVFQRDIRRALTQVGKTPFYRQYDMAVNELNEIIKAVTSLARRKIGALIVIERETGLRDYVESGQLVDARLSREMLLSIFHTASPLHDGGVIIYKGRIHSAGCVLPLSRNPYIDKRYGTRHRAALGLSEETDAVIIVVSEETQKISLVQHGSMTPMPDEETLTKSLREIFVHQDVSGQTWKSWLGKSQAS